jgi:hypothetical protein
VDYPDYQIVRALDPEDPGLPPPGRGRPVCRDAAIAIARSGGGGANRRSRPAGMEPRARHGILLVSDSDAALSDYPADGGRAR